MSSYKVQINIDADQLVECINFFDKNNIEFNMSEEELDSLYSNIISGKNYELIDFFLDRDGSPFIMLNYCYEDDEDVIMFMIDRYDGEPIDFLIESISIGLAEKMLDILSNSIPLKTLFKSCGGKALNAVVESGSRPLLEVFLERGHKISYCTTDPINDALVNNRMNLIECLLEHGSNNNNITLKTFIKCLEKNNNTAVKYFIEHFEGGDIDITNTSDEDIIECIKATVSGEYVEFALDILASLASERSKSLTIEIQSQFVKDLNSRNEHNKFHKRMFFNMAKKYL